MSLSLVEAADSIFFLGQWKWSEKSFFSRSHSPILPWVSVGICYFPNPPPRKENVSCIKTIQALQALAYWSFEERSELDIVINHLSKWEVNLVNIDFHEISYNKLWSVHLENWKRNFDFGDGCSIWEDIWKGIKNINFCIWVCFGSLDYWMYLYLLFLKILFSSFE